MSVAEVSAVEEEEPNDVPGGWSRSECTRVCRDVMQRSRERWRGVGCGGAELESCRCGVRRNLWRG